MASKLPGAAKKVAAPLLVEPAMQEPAASSSGRDRGEARSMELPRLSPLAEADPVATMPRRVNQGERVRVTVQGTLEIAPRRHLEVEVRDLSVTGAGILCPGYLPRHVRGVLSLPWNGETLRLPAQVVWSRTKRAGLHFLLLDLLTVRRLQRFLETV